MFNFTETFEEDTEFGFCNELRDVAEELGIDTSSLAFGLSAEMDTDQLLTIKAALEEAIEQSNQETLRQMGRCCMGYKWRKEGAGYRCEGGSHWVSDAELAAGKNGS